MEAFDWVSLDNEDTCQSKKLKAFTWRTDAVRSDEIDATGALVVERADKDAREVYEGIERWVYNALAHRAFEDDDGDALDDFFERHVVERGEPTATQ